MEQTLLEQVTNAVRERVHPFRVDASEVDYKQGGTFIKVVIEGIREVFGYHSTNNGGLTPDEFADAVAARAQDHISAILNASHKQDRKAIKRRDRVMVEDYECQMKDSDQIFTAISSGDFDDFKQAEQAVVMLYVMDPSFSRSGISHALKRLERFYDERQQREPVDTPNAGTNEVTP